MKLNSWQKVQYRLLWWSCRAVGLLPERVLYFCLGGLIRLILYRLVRYRRQVVRTNLAHSFPEKSEAERREIDGAAANCLPAAEMIIKGDFEGAMAKFNG